MAFENRTPAILSLTMPFYPVKSSYDRRRLFPMDNPALVEDYIAALRREIQGSAQDYEEFGIQAVHIGGGIAGHAADDALGLLMRDLRSWFRFNDDVQISMNVHPGMVSADTLQACQRGRVNWLCVDYMTANPFESEAMSRFLPPSAMDTSMIVLSQSMLNLSFHVLFGLPGQSENSFRNTLDKVIGYGAKEVVLHRLELVPGTPFAEQDIVQYRCSRSPRLSLPDDDACEQMKLEADRYLTERGFSMSAPLCWSSEGTSSRFDVLDGRNCARIGFGLGAITRMDGIEAHNTLDMNVYLRHSDDPGRITASVHMI